MYTLYSCFQVHEKANCYELFMSKLFTTIYDCSRVHTIHFQETNEYKILVHTVYSTREYTYNTVLQSQNFFSVFPQEIILAFLVQHNEISCSMLRLPITLYTYNSYRAGIHIVQARLRQGGCLYWVGGWTNYMH